MDKIFVHVFIFYAAVCVAVSEEINKNETSSINNNNNNNNNNAKNDANAVEISVEILKKLMWKKCSSSSYVMCAKLALVHVIEKLDSTSQSYTILPGVSLQKRDDNGSYHGSAHENRVVVRNDLDDTLDRYVAAKIRNYLASLSLSVKLLDKKTVDDSTRSWSDGDDDEDDDDNFVSHSDRNAESGRGRKKYMHSLLVAGWMSGATLLALTVKSIAILSGKALLAALLSLMFTAISAFGKGHTHGHYNAATKSATYEIITKPIVAHSHASDIQEVHGADVNAAFAYKRSMPVAPEVIVKTETVPEPDDIERLIRKVRDRGAYYGPVSFELSKS